MAENLNLTPAALSESGSAKSIVLFGEALVDCFADREVPGGAPLNVAHHLHALGRVAGLAPTLVTRIGDDEHGRMLTRAMQAAGLSLDGVQHDSAHPTGSVRIHLDNGAHSFEIAADQAWDFIDAEAARQTGLSARPQWIYFGTLAQRAGSVPALHTLLQTSGAAGFLDLNLRDPWVSTEVLRWSLQNASLVKMNQHELRRVGDIFTLRAASETQLGMRLLRAFDLRQLLITAGSDGAWLLNSDRVYQHTAPTLPVTGQIDSVGAGDAFSAVFLLGQSLAWPTELTLERAHRFAAEICRVRGAIPDTDDFYQPFVSDWRLSEPQP